MVWQALGRIVLVLLAFVAAGLGAGFVLLTLGLERLTQTVAANGGAVDLADLIAGGLAVASAVSLVPALTVALVGEIARVRSFLFYVVGGGLALVSIPLIARLQDVAGTGSGGAVWQVFATAGFAGGAVYWLLAGRKA